MNNNIQTVVLQLIGVFFVISLVLFLFLFILNIYLSNKLRKRIKFKLNKRNYLRKLESVKNESDLISYAHLVGELLLSVDNKTRTEIETQLNKKRVYEKIYSIYEKKFFYVSKLYVLSALIQLGNPNIRELCFSIINNNKISKKIFEFKVLAIEGLALSTKKTYHLLELYNLLEHMRKTEYITQEFIKFFFVKTLTLLNNSNIIVFIKNLQFQEITSTTFIFLETLLTLEKNYEIYSAVLELKDNHKDGFKLNPFIAKMEKIWSIKESAVIKNHNIKLKSII